MNRVEKLGIIQEKSTESTMFRYARRLEELHNEMNKDDHIDLYSEAEQIESSMSEIAATGIDEAAVQLMLVAGYLECIRENQEGEFVALIKSMERLTRSALSAVVKKANIDLTEFGGERYVPERTNPFPKALSLH